jgi:hypothetical protein
MRRCRIIMRENIAIRVFYILGVFAIAVTCAVAGSWLKHRGRPDPWLEAILDDHGVAGLLRGGDGGKVAEGGAQSEPALVAQARAFAAILNPPAPAPVSKPIGAPVAASDSLPLLTPKARPAMSSVTFTLVATSYYAGRPDRSMARMALPYVSC